LFMIVVLPLLLYPALGYAALQFMFGFADRPSTIGIVSVPGERDFPPRRPEDAGQSPLPWLAWLRVTTPTLDSWAGGAMLAQTRRTAVGLPAIHSRRPHHHVWPSAAGRSIAVRDSPSEVENRLGAGRQRPRRPNG